MTWLTDLFGWIAGDKTVRRTAERLPTTASNDPTLKGEAFIAGGNYFGVTLAGLHLTDARHFATEVLPLCVCLCEYGYAGKSVGVPFSIGPDELRQRLKTTGAADKAKPAWVELQDLRVIGAKPVTSANLSLFTGLFSVPGDDFVESLLNMVGGLGRSISTVGVALEPGLDIAKTVYGGFNTLLGLKNVTQVVAALNGTMLKQSGYYLLSSAPAGSLPLDGLEVKNGQLYRGKDPVQDVNYCVIALPCYASVLDATKMAPQLLYDPWKTVQDAIQNEPASAPKRFRALQSAILNSPDLIESDRDILMATYAALYDKRIQQLGVQKEAALTRGGGVGGLGASVSRQAIALKQSGNAPMAKRLETIVEALRDESLVPATTMPDGEETEETLLVVAKSMRSRLSRTGAHGSVAEALLKSSF